MSVEDKIRGYILENFLFTDDQSALSSTDSFLEKGLVDSTGILEIMTFIEDEYGFSVEDDEMIPENLDSVINIVKFIGKKTT
jgi:acyl carrier protein